MPPPDGESMAPVAAVVPAGSAAPAPVAAAAVAAALSSSSVADGVVPITPTVASTNVRATPCSAAVALVAVVAAAAAALCWAADTSCGAGGHSGNGVGGRVGGLNVVSLLLP